jgi:hypothetical protein
VGLRKKECLMRLQNIVIVPIGQAGIRDNLDSVCTYDSMIRELVQVMT